MSEDQPVSDPIISMYPRLEPDVAGKGDLYLASIDDTFDHTKWSKKFDSESEARAAAQKVTDDTDMLTAHIDNPDGKLITRFGQYGASVA